MCAVETTLPRDQRDRPLRDLRISVTDRCNFRCTYCMPKEIFGADHVFLQRPQLLSFEEVERVARILAGLGVHKLRLTGGEPLLRRHLDRLVTCLANIEGIDDLCLTTNGALLSAEMAQQLAAAGLNRVTVSLDGLNNATFRELVAARCNVSRVLDAIEHAEAAGLGPVKVNMVVKRGINEQEIVPMAEYFRGTPHILRFIEFMDVGSTNHWCQESVVPAKEVLQIIEAQWPLAPLEEHYRGEVARRWHYQDGQGEIGVIASVTQPFCGDCHRLRLTADGMLYTCLFASNGHDIKGPLRAGASDDTLRQDLIQLWRDREDRYSELRSQQAPLEQKVEMSYLGG